MAAPLNILQISPHVPWPVANGATIGIYNITRSVAARGHHVTFVGFGRGEAESRSSGEAGRREDGRDDNDMPTFCRLEVVAHDTRNTVAKGLRNLFSRDPYPVSKYRSDAMTARLDALCAEQRYDVVHVDHAQMAMYGEYLQRRWDLPYVLREHNFETTIYRRHAEHSRLPIVSRYFRMQAERLYRYEAAALTHPEVIAAITPEDAADIAASLRAQKGESPASGRIAVIPAGVDVDRLRQFSAEPDPAHVVVVGPLVWGPNVDAAEWFASSIWPRISAAVPEARCTIAGEAPPRRLLRFATDRLRFPGFVDAYEELLASATVMAVPLRIGGGMRIKLLEFFSHGKAVVSTAVGAEGNVARDGEHFLRADGEEDFANAVVALFRDAEKRRALGSAARTLMESSYSWAHIGELFEQAYLDAISRRRSG